MARTEHDLTSCRPDQIAMQVLNSPSPMNLAPSIAGKQAFQARPLVTPGSKSVRRVKVAAEVKSSPRLSSSSCFLFLSFDRFDLWRCSAKGRGRYFYIDSMVAPSQADYSTIGSAGSLKCYFLPEVAALMQGRKPGWKLDKVGVPWLREDA